MNILILDSWLRNFLDTNAKPHDIARCLSLCGPSVERVVKTTNLGKIDYLYDIEVTTNRVDMMSVVGIAKEASVILPEFGYFAKFKSLNTPKILKPKNPLSMKVELDPKLTSRVVGIIFDDIKNRETPEWMKERLEKSGFRSLGAVVDITNYVMTEVGHPTHVFDYDLINTKKFKLRESRKNERIVSLEDKEYILPGGDIVIDDSMGRIIDLPGIIGTKNSVVNENTKRVLFFMETNDPVRIRKTSMTLGIRTIAATLNEKGVDPELSDIALSRGISLFQSICKARVASNKIDVYPKKQKPNKISLEHTFIEKILGISIERNRVNRILKSLGFSVKLTKTGYEVITPSSRTRDIQIPQDVVEEVVRIYGYHNIPNIKLSGMIPDKPENLPFEFEFKTKNILKELGASEIYTYSLVSKEMTKGGELKLVNPLGSEHSYLRTSLHPSLVKAVEQNKLDTQISLFEIANVYMPKRGNLPDEIMTLAGIFVNTDYKNAKGFIEALLNKLFINYSFKISDADGFKVGHRLQIISNKLQIGSFGVLTNNNIYYEFDMETLRKLSGTPTYTPIPQYPAHIEDLTLVIPAKTYVGYVINAIENSGKYVSQVNLIDTFNDAHTFRVWYQDENKTLTDNEVEKIRQEIIKMLASKFGITTKE